MQKLLLIASLIMSTSLFSQHRADIWYFGEEAGLDFSSGSPVAISNSNMYAESGCATICDTNGQLLFYTNGQKIWDRENNIMPNGDSIFASNHLNQNSLIIPDPANKLAYFLFTRTSGLSYSIIEMDKNNGLGDVVQKNIPLPGYINGKITAINHCNSDYSWVVVKSSDSSFFYSYLVSDTAGVSNYPTISYIGTNILADIGNMKASPTGNKIALPINSSEVLFELYDFDNSTGIISNPIKINKEDDIIYAYGCEFSADSKFLYIATGGQNYDLLQFDLRCDTEEAIKESSVKIATGNINGLQIGPNSKIYIARVNDNYLSVINHPGLKGEDCFFESKEISLGDKISLMGLPNFNQSYFYTPYLSYNNTCLGETTSMWFDIPSIIDSVNWNIASVGIDTTLVNFPFSIENTFEIAKNYTVRLLAYHCEEIDTIINDITINRSPEIDLGNDTTIMGGNTIILDAGEGMFQYLWNTGDFGQQLIVWDTGTYWVQVEKNGCFSMDTISIQVIPSTVQLPTAFSPNGDGTNDIFQPKVTGIISGFEIRIFNRYGQEVWQSTNLDNGWNGNYNGSKCPIDTYVWQMQYKTFIGEKIEIINETGNVTLLR